MVNSSLCWQHLNAYILNSTFKQHLPVFFLEGLVGGKKHLKISIIEVEVILAKIYCLLSNFILLAIISQNTGFCNRSINKSSSLKVFSIRSLLQPTDPCLARLRHPHQLCWENPMSWTGTDTMGGLERDRAAIVTLLKACVLAASLAE